MLPASSTVAPLTDQVACAYTIDPDMLARVHHEVLGNAREWVTGYGEFQSGGWGTLSLLNASGNAQDVTIGDAAAPVPTDLLGQMPATRALLDGLGLRYMWARLALLGADSYLWEHRDYQELADVERHRLHVPLVTNSSAALILGGHAVHLAAGHLWRLTPTYAHGACNASGPARIHLILDCYASPELEALRRLERLPVECVRELPVGEPHVLAAAAATAQRLVRLGYRDAAEQHLLRLFFRYRLTEGGIYDTIASVYRGVGDHDAAQEWRNRRRIMLGTHKVGEARS